MTMHTLRLVSVAVLATSLLSPSAKAGPAEGEPVDTTVLIDQAKALAGGVSAGDSAGYPITINQPGHYKLMGNLSVPGGVIGIAVNANDVTIDLNGFSITGQVTCTGFSNVNCSQTAGHGINGSPAQRMSVRNGSVAGFGYCVYTAQGARVSDLSLGHCYVGLVANYGSVATRIAVHTATTGIAAYASTVESAQVYRATTGVTGAGSILNGVDVYNATTGVAYLGNGGKIGVRGSAFLATTPLDNAISLGGNLCNGSAC
jgi:hypothetical protein